MPDIRKDSAGRPYRAGDHLRVWRTVENLPSGATIDKAYLVVKERLDDADDAALVNLTITPVETASGHVVDVGDGAGQFAVGTGRVRFDLLPKHTRKIGANVRNFGIKLILSTGETYTADADVIELAPEVIAATT